MKLLFIYNANSGKLNAFADAMHKLFSPDTYQCSLCSLTYDTFSENTIWKTFRKKHHVNMEFYHKDEFETTFPNVRIIYPAILKLEDTQLTTVLNSDVLYKIVNVEGLIETLKSSI